MFDFTKKDSYTLQDVFDSLFHHAQALLEQLPKERYGRLEKYIDIAKRIEDQVKPENFSISGFNALLDEFDDGRSVANKKKYKYALPLVHHKGDCLFAELMRGHMQQVLDNRDKLDISGYSWYIRGLIKIGMINVLPKQITELDKRIDAYYEKKKKPEQAPQKKTKAFTPYFQSWSLTTISIQGIGYVEENEVAIKAYTKA